jgi:glycosyltransferase involved in cell wall biosynthesis
MKILFVHTDFVPHTMRGGEVYAYNLARELAQAHQMAVFYPVQDTHQERYSILKDTYQELPLYKIAIDRWPSAPHADLFDGMLLHQFKQVVAEFQPDVIHYHSLLRLSMCLLNSEISVPKVFTLHDCWLMCPRVLLMRRDDSLCEGPEGGLLCVTCRDPLQPAPQHTAFRDRILHFRRRLISNNFEEISRGSEIFNYNFRDQYARQKANNVDLFIAPSRLYRNFHINWGVNPQRIVHSPYGTDVSRFSNFRKSLSDKLRFGFIGSIDKVKGVHLLVEAFRRLGSVSAELQIHGRFISPAFEEELKRRAQGVPIHFMGEFHTHDLARVLAEIDVLVLPSIVYEDCPMVVLEAQAVKIPAIVSDTGGAAELVRPNLDGLHFQRANIDSLAQKMRAFIDEPALLEKMRENIRPVKTIEENARELEGYYERVISQRAGLPM